MTSSARETSPLAAEITIVRRMNEADGPFERRLALRRCHVRALTPEAFAADPDQSADLVLFMGAGPDVSHALRALRAVRNAAETPALVLARDLSKLETLALFAAGANDVLDATVEFELTWARLSAQLRVRTDYRKAMAAQMRLMRRMSARAHLDDLGYGDADHRRLIMRDLKRAMRDGGARMVYQPQLCIRQGRIIGAEALMRWTDPQRGPVSPAQFIPIAEETGDIAEITLWAMEQALTDHAAVCAAAGRAIRISVNLSASLVCNAAFMDRLFETVSIAPKAIGLELTEQASFEDPDLAITHLRRFADLGVRIAIDDYGAGLSSLAYIQRLPAQELKVDRTFITRLTESHRDPVLVRSTIELAHALEWEVVAEGVEDAETLLFLRVMGCDIAQGYHIGMPMTVGQLCETLAVESASVRLAAQ